MTRMHAMSSPSVTLRQAPRMASVDPVAARERSVRRRIYAAYGLLFFNTLTYTAGMSVLHLQSKEGKGLAQAALPLALLVLLTINPKIKLRPNVFLCIVCLLVVDVAITATQVHHLGTTFRTVRLIEFLAALWMLTPWWGRRDMLLLRCHLFWLLTALGSVFLGMLIAPGRAFSYGGRLTGAIWPMFPTQIAQYAAVVIGLLAVLWLSHLVSGRAALAGAVFSFAILLLTHTRTALIALLAGILIAGLSLFTVNARVRKFFAAAVVLVSVGVVTAAGFVATWLARGESTQGLASLTGRTNFWALVLNVPRTKFQEIFGFGLSNASINGLPIDSNWLASYLQEGLFGVVVCSMMLVYLFVAALFQSQSTRRALILFIVTYCVIASITEDTFTDVSTYLMHLTIAASLLVLSGIQRVIADPAD
jgi:hypothetical protein